MNTVQKHEDHEIAIIGIGCRLPGGIESAEELWEFLSRKGDAIVDVPPERWSINRFYDPDYETPCKTYMRKGGFITQRLDELEPLFFGISPREATLMDPQQRLLLEVTWEAMENASLIPQRLAGSRTGVFIGSFSLDWLAHSGSPLNRSMITDHFAATAASATMLSARLSHAFGFAGPCFTVDTACSSSLVALHQACSSLLSGETNLAITGGVNIMFIPAASISMSKGHFLSPDGRCKSFDAGADGYGRGEGCGIVVLKRLSDALRDNDPIAAVISGTGVNQDGRTASITLPSGQAQENLIREVAERAKIALGDVAYVEAHGTGTPVGDPIEARAIGSAIGQYRPQGDPLVIGSVKANLGHLEAAAGITGLIKAVLCARHHEVPPQVNLVEPNPSIPFDDLNLCLPHGAPLPLAERAGVVYAGVNSFGYGGTNAMAIIRTLRPDEEGSVLRNSNPKRPSGEFLFPISTFSDQSLQGVAARYAEMLQTKKNVLLEDVCYSLGKFRTRFATQAVIVGSDSSEISSRLLKLSQGISDPDIIVGKRVGVDSPVFVFTGMGPQWWGMGRHLLGNDVPVETRELVQACDAHFSALAGWSLVEEILRPESESQIDKTWLAQPAIFLIQIALAETLRVYGITPAAIVGHSVGEVAAAYIAGVFSLQDAVALIYHRSQLQNRLSGKGTMLAVGLSAEEASSELIAGMEAYVSVAAINSVRACTLAGRRDELAAIDEICSSRSIFSRFLNVEVPYHSPQVTEIEQDMMAALGRLSPSAPLIPLYSTVTGGRVDQQTLHDAGYWYANARQTVRFSEAVDALLSDGHRIFLEVGPHPVLGASIREIATARDNEVAAVYSLHRKEAEDVRIARCVAELSVSGVRMDWDNLVGGARITLPNYVWARGRFWSEGEEALIDRVGGNVHPILGMIEAGPERAWSADINVNYMPWIPDHRVDDLIVFPAAGYIEAALAAHYQIDGSEAAILENLTIGNALILGSGATPTVRWTLDTDTHVLSAAVAGHSLADEWTIHARVEILSGKPWYFSELNVEDIDLHAVIDPRAFYGQLSEQGFQYGPAFQTIRELRVGEGEALSRLRLAEEQSAEVDNYFLHPALLDGALQTLIGAGYTDGDDQFFVPVSVGRFLYFGARASSAIVHARCTSRSLDEIEGEIRLYDEDGKPLAQLSGFVARKINRPGRHPRNRMQRLVYRDVWQETPKESLLAEPLEVVLAGRDVARATMLGRVLRDHGVEVHDVVGDTAFDYVCLEQIAVGDCRAVIYLCEPSEEELPLSQISDLLALGRGLPVPPPDGPSPRLIIVTSHAVLLPGIETSDPTQAALRGFARGLAAERPDLSVKVIDVDKSIEQLAMRDLAAEVLLLDTEDDVVLHGAKRFVNRLVSGAAKAEPPAEPVAPAIQTKGVKLVPGAGGSLEKVHYAFFEREAPGSGQVEFRTLAASLNFKDVLKVMGILPSQVVEGTYHGNSLGMEASVEVIAVGPDVQGFAVGERFVVSYPGCFASHFTADVSRLYALKMDELGAPAQGATLPVAFVTAYYGLCRLAQLRAGETVLIHSGTGGVGLAAIQIAQSVGARVFATAGSDEKRDYLREIGCEQVWNSRTLEFSAGVREATGGRGVDVVLNSLSGEAQTHSLKCVAPFGRFVEIGKRDIIENRRLSLTPFNENLSFFSLDLDRMMVERPSLMWELLEEIASMARAGTIKALPYKAYRAADSVDAFKLLATSRHIGKVVINYEDIDDLVAVPVQTLPPGIRADGTYLITGGFGGFGLETAKWLGGHGARHLVLVGRNGATADGTRAEIDRLIQSGITIVERLLDVADRRAVQALVSELSTSEAPLAGVFHCAGIIDDGLIYGLDIDRIENVLRSKAQGAIVLDQVTRELDLALDYFVLYSSVTTLLGNIGQSAYIAANAVLDALAARRHAQGLAGLAINWGAIGNVGMLQRNPTASRALEAAGLVPMNAASALDTLPMLMDLGMSAVAIVDIDWSRWFSVFPAADTRARFSALVRSGGNMDGMTPTLLALSALPEEDRLPFVTEKLKEIIATTLHLAPDAIDDRARLSELGIDSLAGVELQTAIRTDFGVEISILVLAKDDNIREMARLLQTRIKVDYRVP